MPVAGWFDTLPPLPGAVRAVEVERDTATEVSALLDLDGGTTLRLRCRVEDEPPHRIAFQLLSPALPRERYDDVVVERDGRVVPVRDFRGDGPPLLLWHGSGCDASVWEAMVPHLAGFRVLAQDLPGHGASPLPRLTVADAVADVDAVVAELGLESPAVVGHSLGGWAALHLAATRPCRGLVCLDGPTNLAFEAMGLDPRHPGWVPDPPDVDADLGALRCRALVVLCGDTPGAVDFRTGLGERIAAEHPHVRVEWRAADHMLVLSQPEETAALVRGFLRAEAGA